MQFDVQLIDLSREDLIAPFRFHPLAGFVLLYAVRKLLPGHEATWIYKTDAPASSFWSNAMVDG